MGSIRTLQISHSFPFTLNPTPKTISSTSFPPPPPRAADPSQTNTNPDTPPAAEPETTTQPDPTFENRLSQVRLKYRSGTGKKAEQRRSKKSSSSSKSGGAGGVMLPHVPLREPKTAGGLKVDLGFTSYSERLNGVVAGIGLAALVLVELASGEGLLSYHRPPILFIQVYTVAALAALFVKYEKERISVWPQKAAPPPSSASPAIGE